MYHQFKELADVDITTGPMEVGPTCHYMMGGIRVDAETAQSTLPGSVRRGRSGRRLAWRKSAWRQLALGLAGVWKRAGKAAAEHAKTAPMARLDSSQIEAAEREMLAPFAHTGEYPYEIHRDLQETMQAWSASSVTKKIYAKRWSIWRSSKPRLAQVRIEGSRMFNPGWHLTRDLRSMLLISEAVTRSAMARQESRGAHSRIDYPKLDDAWGKKTQHCRRVGAAR